MVQARQQATRFLTKRDVVVAAIRRDILNGVLPPGAQLQQDEIAARLGVSPTPVREAFGALQAEGFLENMPHRGVFVANPSYADLIDIYDVRGMVEGLALRRAAAPIRDVARRLGRLNARSEQALKGNNVERIRRTTNEFHQAIIEMANSPTLAEIAEKLVARSLFFLPFDPAHMQRVLSEHVGIADSLLSGDLDGAVELLHAHHMRHAQRLRSMMGDVETARPGSRLTA